MIIARLFIKIIAPEVHIRKTNGDTEFEWKTNTIYFNPAANIYDAGFARHIEEKHFFLNPTKYSMPLWSLLHELGHYFNPDEEEDIESKAICAALPYELAQKNQTLQNMYYDSPDEYAATEWAIEWITQHPRLSSLFSILLKPSKD